VLSFVVLILYNEIFKDLLLFNKDEQVITTSSIDTNSISYDDFIYVVKNDLKYYGIGNKIYFPLVILVNNQQTINHLSVEYINSREDSLNQKIKEVVNSFSDNYYTLIESRNVKNYIFLVAFDESVTNVNIQKVGLKINNDSVIDFDIGNISIEKVDSNPNDLYIDTISGYVNLGEIKYYNYCETEVCLKSVRNIGEESTYSIKNKRMQEIQVIKSEIVNSNNTDIKYISSSSNLLTSTINLKPYDKQFFNTTGYSYNLTITSYQFKITYIIDGVEKVAFSNSIIVRPMIDENIIDYIIQDILKMEER
ncbi:MAG: hypothetical protein K0Q49_1598, partial [Haloplasmataceae bacterium]|nr:hypothetical protein [Haloplasmataceae bacterium]